MFYLTLFLLLFAYAKQVRAEIEDDMMYLPGLEFHDGFRFYGQDLSADAASFFLVSGLFALNEQHPLTDMAEQLIKAKKEVSYSSLSSSLVKHDVVDDVLSDDDALSICSKLDEEEMDEEEMDETYEMIGYDSALGALPLPNGVGKWVMVEQGRFVYVPDTNHVFESKKESVWSRVSGYLEQAKRSIF